VIITRIGEHKKRFAMDRVTKWRDEKKRKQFRHDYPWFSHMEVSVHPNATTIENIASFYSGVIWPFLFFGLFPFGMYMWFIAGAGPLISFWSIYVLICHEISRHILKPHFSQFRPDRSLSQSPYGFPSNHSLTSVLILTLILNYIIVYELSHAYTALTLVTITPILPGRIILQDHTTIQVLAGGSLGFIAALIGLSIGL